MKYICLHGHFYQPPRENPWLEEVEIQESAYPYHDWNQRITAECYAPNAQARILDAEKKIVNIVNNYAKMNFNFGPSLLSWMQHNDLEAHDAIVRSDMESQKNFSGHGSAIAQCYNHMIMPLANTLDKQTQIIWGLRDFEKRFKRQPEGMWLPEAAVDSETLDLMAQQGIKFTILAPHQAKQIRLLGEELWTDVSGARIDIRRPYLCRLPSGRSMALFFYDGPVSRNIAFSDLLNDGENLANCLLGLFSDQEIPQLVHTATDGETYGHHHHMGDMALAYCVSHIETEGLAKITNYAEFLSLHPPEYEVQIFENSSWSCAHGVERWRAPCGCSSGMHPGWQQNWRTPLRDAMDWLRDCLTEVYEQKGAEYFPDIWQTRDDYIDVILDRSRENVEKFLAQHSYRPLNKEDKVAALKLLEMQRHAMLMYTSCGWFFDEISGLENVQILRYAARAIQLAQETAGSDLESDFSRILKKAPSNLPRYGNAWGVYEQHVKPEILDLGRVAAHYVIASLFERRPEAEQVYCYSTKIQSWEREESGKNKLAFGRVLIQSLITWEEKRVDFAAVYMGEQNLTAGILVNEEGRSLSNAAHQIREDFRRGDVAAAMASVAEHFPDGKYSLQHLFRDEQSKVLYQILDTTLEDIYNSLHQIKEYHHVIINVVKQLQIPLPKILSNTVLVMLNTDLLQVLSEDKVDFKKLEQLVAEASTWDLEVDKVTMEFIVRNKLNKMLANFARRPRLATLEMAENLLRTVRPLKLPLDLWRVQNIYFAAGKKYYERMKAKSVRGNKKAQKWVDYFDRLGEYLQIRLTISRQVFAAQTVERKSPQAVT